MPGKRPHDGETRVRDAARPLPYGLAATTFLVQIAIGVVLFAIFQEYVPNTLGASDAWPGFLVTTYGATRFVLETPTGALLDRIERRTGLFIGLVLMTPSLVLMNLVRDETLYLLFSAMLGVGTAFIWPSAYSIGADLYPAQQRAQVVGILNVGQFLGFGVGALMGALFVESEPGILFLAAIMALVAGLLIAWRTVPSYPNPTRGHAQGGTRVPLREALTPPIVLVATVMMLVTACSGAVVVAMRPFGEDQLDTSFRGVTIALIPALVIGAAAYVPAGRIADRSGRIVPLLIATVGLGAALFAISTATSIWLAAMIAIPGFAAYALAVPAWNALIMDLAPESHRGVIIGFTVAVTGFGLALGTFFGGIIVEAAGAPAVFRTAGGVLGFVAALLVIISRMSGVRRPAHAGRNVDVAAPPAKG